MVLKPIPQGRHRHPPAPQLCSTSASPRAEAHTIHATPRLRSFLFSENVQRKPLKSPIFHYLKIDHFSVLEIHLYNLTCASCLYLKGLVDQTQTFMLQ